MHISLTEGPKLVAFGSSNSRAFRALVKSAFFNGDFPNARKKSSMEGCYIPSSVRGLEEFFILSVGLGRIYASVFFSLFFGLELRSVVS